MQFQAPQIARQDDKTVNLLFPLYRQEDRFCLADFRFHPNAKIVSDVIDLLEMVRIAQEQEGFTRVLEFLSLESPRNANRSKIVHWGRPFFSGGSFAGHAEAVSAVRRMQTSSSL
jgi:hypothetical protein